MLGHQAGEPRVDGDSLLGAEHVEIDLGQRNDREVVMRLFGDCEAMRGRVEGVERLLSQAQ